MNIVNEQEKPQNLPESKSESVDQKFTAEKTSSEINKAKLVFCALLESSLLVRNEFFDVDLYKFANEKTAEIAEGGVKNKGDKKYVARNTYKLMQQVQNMRGDRVAMEGRLNILIDKTLKQVPEEDRKQYPEIMEYMKEIIKNR